MRIVGVSLLLLRVMDENRSRETVSRFYWISATLVFVSQSKICEWLSLVSGPAKMDIYG